MIQLVEDRRKVSGISVGGIWIGDSADESHADLDTEDIGAILNVAQDMPSTRGWYHGIEEMHVGLIDGPGNETSTYWAAVLALFALLRRHNTLVCCHSGGRALAVVIMFQEFAKTPTKRRSRTWHEWVTLLSEKTGQPLPEVNPIHVEAFASIAFTRLEMRGVT